MLGTFKPIKLKQSPPGFNQTGRQKKQNNPVKRLLMAAEQNLKVKIQQNNPCKQDMLRHRFRMMERPTGEQSDNPVQQNQTVGSIYPKGLLVRRGQNNTRRRYRCKDHRKIKPKIFPQYRPILQLRNNYKNCT
ncbi:MAG: hypothetical protein LBS05_09800 [Tannerellaceae bacterium]|nr:hypothetical protein [Tannerellaceae bacterium]